MKIRLSNESVKNLEISDPTMCVYQLIYDKNDNDDTKYTRYYYALKEIMHQDI